MQVDLKLYEILKNVSRINEGVTILSDNTIVTMLRAGGLGVEYKLSSEPLPSEISIANLAEFINIITISSTSARIIDCEIDFTKEYMIIKSIKGDEIRYHYSNALVIKDVDDEIIKWNNMIQFYENMTDSFKLSHEVLSNYKKVSNIMGLNLINFNLNYNNEITVKLYSDDGINKTVYTSKIEVTLNERFDITLPIENFITLNCDYDVEVGERLITLINDEFGVIYYIAGMVE